MKVRCAMPGPQVDDFRIDDAEYIFMMESIHPRDFEMNFHRHDFFELTYVLGGRGRYELLDPKGTNSTVPVESNQMLLWDGRVPHKAQDDPENPLRQSIVIFDLAYLKHPGVAQELQRQLARSNPLVIRNPMFTTRLKPLMRTIMMELSSKKKLCPEVVYSNLLNVLTTMLRTSMDLEHLSNDTLDSRIKKAVAYIHENYFNHISVKEMASYCSLSVRHFSELFKRHTSQTFIQYLHAYRIEIVKKALCETTRSITEIAFEAGYDDPAHFIQHFRKLSGTTPSQYRKLQRGTPDAGYRQKQQGLAPDPQSTKP
ncbi:MAG: helix-turn-helix domain-containing protein [Clostridia bacterium]